MTNVVSAKPLMESDFARLFAIMVVVASAAVQQHSLDEQT